MMAARNEGLDVKTRRWRWAAHNTAGAWMLAVALCGHAPAWSARPAAKPAEPPLQGTVTKVTDGDSLWFTPSGQAHIVVRLADIDAPETCQNWGPEARQALADMVMGKPALLQTKGRDVHGRVLGALRVDELDVGTRLVEDGQAWSSRSRWDQGPLVKQERMARALRRGLHATGDAEMPRNFRVRHGPCAAGPAR
jgi:endonuclease YncB( thermonuclease family)